MITFPAKIITVLLRDITNTLGTPELDSSNICIYLGASPLLCLELRDDGRAGHLTKVLQD